MICARCGSVMVKDGVAATVCPECSAETVRQLRAEGPTCPRCGATMIRDPEGEYYCYPCRQSAPRPNLHPLPPGGLKPSPPPGDAFRKLTDRVAKLESAVLDLRRRLETADERRLRKIREALAEQGLLPPGEDPQISRVPKLGDDRCKIHDTQPAAPNTFLDPRGNEEPSPGEPGETR